MGHAEQTGAKPVRDPHVAAAIDGETAIVDAGLEVPGLAWIGRGEAGNVIYTAIGYPNPVLLVDPEMKGCSE
jgi:hypothetical protein